ncbi:polymorphic toxin-type HINT domain-containing protein [Streptomyces sp. NPDC057565]|uniref:polymorphic toxin-type HINT domain-containing protein n=1 Tax=Streptomyces sp. NPDC057565 TaxID=3346169 RepID=UPI003690F0C2
MRLLQVAACPSGADSHRYAFAGGNPISFVELDGHLFGIDISLSDVGHAALDVAGMVPVIGEVADVANGVWYMAEGNYVDGAMSMAAAIPGAGNAVTAAKWAKKGAKAVDAVKGAAKAGGKKVAGGAKKAAGKAKAGVNKATDKVKSKVKGGKKACTKGAKKNSFVPGTKVAMADGSQKNIEDLKVGEYVLASDPETGDLQARQITDTIVGDGLKHLVTLTVDPDGKNGKAKPSKLTATANHPFWLPDFGKWVDASELEPGTWLQTAAGTWVQVTAVDEAHRTQRVYNLTVDGVHTYYVLAGQSAVLVHNSGQIPLNCQASESAQVSMQARMDNGIAAARNVAVYRIGSGDNARYLAAANEGSRHSERVLDAYIDKAGISPGDVTGIYSERQPCSSIPNLCGARIGRYKNAADDISWSLNPDGPGYTGFNKARIRDAMDDFVSNPAASAYEWITG